MSTLIRGLDVGWGNVKYTSGPDEMIKFSSITGPTPANYGNTSVGLGNALAYQMLAPWPYLVGPAAFAQGFGSPDLSPKWVTSQAYKVLALTAVAGSGVSGGYQDVSAVVGLPPAYLKDHKDPLVRSLNGVYTTRFAHLEGVATTKLSVTVIAQGVGALLVDIIEPDGSIADSELDALLDPELARNYGVIDVGAGTACIVGTNGIRPIESQTRSCKHGAWAVEALAREQLSAAHGPASVENFSRAALMNRLRRNDFRIYGHHEDTNTILYKAIKEVAQRVALEVRAAWGDAGNFDRIILTGGGGIMMQHELQHHIPGLHLVQSVDPLFANAEGYRRLGLVLEELK
jgi:hypothetical protein